MSTRKTIQVTQGEDEIQVGVPRESGTYLLGEDEKNLSITNVSPGRYLVERSDGRVWTLDVEGEGRERIVTSGPNGLRVAVASERELLLGSFGGAGEEGSGRISVAMPGKVVKVLVAEGDAVEAGVPVMIVEAMKMENEVKSTAAGVVSAVHVAVGDAVDPDQCLVEIDTE